MLPKDSLHNMSEPTNKEDAEASLDAEHDMIIGIGITILAHLDWSKATMEHGAEHEHTDKDAVLHTPDMHSDPTPKSWKHAQEASAKDKVIQTRRDCGQVSWLSTIVPGSTSLSTGSKAD